MGWGVEQALRVAAIAATRVGGGWCVVWQSLQAMLANRTGEYFEACQVGGRAASFARQTSLAFNHVKAWHLAVWTVGGDDAKKVTGGSGNGFHPRGVEVGAEINFQH